LPLKKDNWNNFDNYHFDGQLFGLFQLSLLFSCDAVISCLSWRGGRKRQGKESGQYTSR
jgi:hypothetical protein